MTNKEEISNKTLFSICIPNYNYATYIGETIESILTQDCQDFEVIVADNASTDNSIEIVERYAKESGKIRVIQNRFNIGFAPNLERAARPAQGQFMLMLSSDDVMMPGALSKYKAVIEALGENSNNAVITSALTMIDSEGHRFGRIEVPSWYPLKPAGENLVQFNCKQIYGIDMIKYALSLHNNPLPFASTLYSRYLYERVEGYNGTWTISPDYHFVLKLLRQNPLVVCLEDELFGYRIHTSNQSAQSAGQKSLKYEFDAYQRCLEYEKIVEEFGVQSEQMKRVLVESICMRKGMGYLSRGNWSFAFRLFCLAWALYPAIAIRSPRTYGLATLLLLGPIGRAMAMLIKKFRGDQSAEPELS